MRSGTGRVPTRSEWQRGVRRARRSSTTTACSVRSFGLAARAAPSARSSAGELPRGAVPARAAVVRRPTVDAREALGGGADEGRRTAADGERGAAGERAPEAFDGAQGVERLVRGERDRTRQDELGEAAGGDVRARRLDGAPPRPRRAARFERIAPGCEVERRRPHRREGGGGPVDRLRQAGRVVRRADGSGDEVGTIASPDHAEPGDHPLAAGEATPRSGRRAGWVEGEAADGDGVGRKGQLVAHHGGGADGADRECRPTAAPSGT